MSSTAIPHTVTRDDEYKGYLIPKGAVVMGAARCVVIPYINHS
jgi:hypothetical protein